MIPAAAAGKIRALGGGLVLVATPAATPAITWVFQNRERSAFLRLLEVWLNG